jgi:hypothetical protein
MCLIIVANPVGALREFAETTTSLVLSDLRVAIDFGMHVTTSHYFFIPSLTHAIKLIWRNAIKVDNLIKVIKKWN